MSKASGALVGEKVTVNAMRDAIRRQPPSGLLLFALTLLVAVAIGGARANNQPFDPASFVADFADRAVRVLSSDELADSERQGAFRSLLRAGFDMPVIGRAVLGRHWRGASLDQRAAFLELFEAYIIATYYRRLDAYSGQHLVVGEVERVGRKDVMVGSRLAHADQPDVGVQWRLRPVDDGWRIIDVLVEGVSMAITLRSEFATLIERGEGQFDALLDALRAKARDVTVVTAD